MIAFILAVVCRRGELRAGYRRILFINGCFPKASGSAVILVKAMVSFGQMIYIPYRQRLVEVSRYLVRLYAVVIPIHRFSSSSR